MSSNQKPAADRSATTLVQGGDDEPDPWDQRINDTGCSAENERLNNCYFEKKDWRLCKAEMDAFKECWKAKGNTKRTASRNS